jgi:hypothetical protein
MKNFLLLLTMMASINAFSKTHELLVVTSSEDSNYSKLELETDDATGEALNLIVRDFDSKNVLTAEDEFSYDEINDGGAILSESDGHDVVVIRKIQVDPSKGGNVTLDLLGNALTGKRLSYEMKLVKSSAGFKMADVKTGKEINSLHFIARKILGKAVGIKEVRTK